LDKRKTSLIKSVSCKKLKKFCWEKIAKKVAFIFNRELIYWKFETSYSSPRKKKFKNSKIWEKLINSGRKRFQSFFVWKIYFLKNFLVPIFMRVSGTSNLIKFYKSEKIFQASTKIYKKKFRKSFNRLFEKKNRKKFFFIKKPQKNILNHFSEKLEKILLNRLNKKIINLLSKAKIIFWAPEISMFLTNFKKRID